MTRSSESRPRRHAPVPWERRFAPRSVLLALGTLAALNLAFYFLGVRPAAREERESLARNAQLAKRVQEARLEYDRFRDAAKRIDKADTDGSSLVQRIALPRRSAFSALLTELGTACGESGVEIRETSYEVQPIQGSETYGILAVNANFRGLYRNLVQLLFRLDRSELFFIIGALGATPRQDGRPGELQINMRFDTLVRDM